MRALRALDALAAARRPMTNLEIAESLAIGPSSALGLMRELCLGGFVIRDPRTKRFWLDPRAEGVGSRLHRATALPAAMARLVQQLTEATGESISLSAQFETRICVMRLTQGPEGARTTLHEGRLGPLLGSGAGICILSQMSPAERAQLIRRCRHYGDSFGPGRRSVGDLETAIRGVQERGYIAQYLRAAGGVAGIAFPVRVEMPVHPFGALVVGGSAARIRRREREIVATVQRMLPRCESRREPARNSAG